MAEGGPAGLICLLRIGLRMCYFWGGWDGSGGQEVVSHKTRAKFDVMTFSECSKKQRM